MLLTLPTDYPRLRVVDSFEALLATPFADGINALCWPRELPGDFAEVIALLPAAEGILPLDEATLEALPVSPHNDEGEGGREAVQRVVTKDRVDAPRACAWGAVHTGWQLCSS